MIIPFFFEGSKVNAPDPSPVSTTYDWHDCTVRKPYADGLRLARFTLSVFALALIMSFAAHAESLPLLTRHVRDVTVNGQARTVGHLPATQSMRLVLALPLRNEPALDDLLGRLYDPSDARYRRFLTVEEFTSQFGPTQQDYDTVIRFADASGLRVLATSRNRLNLSVVGTVANIERAFGIQLNIYQDRTDSRAFYAPDREPTTDLPFRLWHISGLDNYSIPRPNIEERDLPVHSNATTGSCPEQSFCGSDMRAAYYGGTALTGKGQYVGLLEFAGTDLADLDAYYTNAHQTNNVPITLLSVDGTPTTCLFSQGCDDTEQTIDMTQALGMAPKLAGLTEFIGSTDAAILNAMATANPLSAQLSSSWTWFPADPKTDDPYFKEFAAQGQNFFQAAGGGKWSSTSKIYPADDPYVVSVSGTDLETEGPGGPWMSETASNGGGGVSPDKFPIPAWQVKTAKGCIDPCSTTYRNGPDVAANAGFSFFVCADQLPCTANQLGGVSFAAPMWAGYLALANQAEVASGHKTLGFINPALYSVGLSSRYNTDFHDITSGSNGYNATTGYDLATGWGSPKAGGFIK